VVCFGSACRWHGNAGFHIGCSQKDLSHWTLLLWYCLEVRVASVTWESPPAVGLIMLFLMLSQPFPILVIVDYRRPPGIRGRP